MTAPRAHRTAPGLRDGSLADQVVTWLRQHPDEELTAKDVAIKFAVVKHSGVCKQLAGAVRRGHLLRTGAHPAVYRLGNGHPLRVPQAAGLTAAEVSAALMSARRLVHLLETAQEQMRASAEASA